MRRRIDGTTGWASPEPDPNRREVIFVPPAADPGPWRRLLIALLGGRWVCLYCGKRYVPCHSDGVNSLMPAPRDGYCCPDGHEGYTDRHVCYGSFIRDRFDHVAETAE